jgi:hypothetical protein
MRMGSLRVRMTRRWCGQGDSWILKERIRGRWLRNKIRKSRRRRDPPAIYCTISIWTSVKYLLVKNLISLRSVEALYNTCSRNYPMILGSPIRIAKVVKCSLDAVAHPIHALE